MANKVAVKWMWMAVVALAFAALVPWVALADSGDSAAPLANSGQPFVTAQADSPTVVANATGSVTYRSYVQSKRWTKSVSNGKTSGTTNQSLRIEALRVKVASNVAGTVNVGAYVQKKGWKSKSVNVGKTAEVGAKGKSLRVEAFRIQLSGDVAQAYDIVYRAYLQGAGWQPWVMNNATAGSAGKGKRVEALQIKLVKKGSGSSASLKDGTYVISATSGMGATLSATGKSQPKKAAYKSSLISERFYLRNERGGTVSLQSVGTGLFLAAGTNGKVAQQADANVDAQRWKLTYSGGYRVQNVETGDYLAFESGKAVLAAQGGAWEFTSTALIPNGNFRVKNAKANTYLAVDGLGYKNADNVVVKKKGKNKAQVFMFTNLGGSTYDVKNAYSYQGLEVAGGSKKSGANVRQYTMSSSSSQRWTVKMERSGRMVFTNKASGKRLTAAGSAKSGKNVTSSKATSGLNQRWVLSQSSYAGNPAIPRAAKRVEGRSSKTPYIITVDLRNHWVCVFKGKQGNWKLVKSWIASHGRQGNGTPRGDFEIHGHSYASHGGSSIYYYTYFKSRNAFHSVKFKHGSMTKLNDGRLGRRISLGCVRLQLENAKYIYGLPLRTHVNSYV